jgi:peptidoglycan/xylan/chitin deacetylase (PgdA/CDA1 family)
MPSIGLRRSAALLLLALLLAACGQSSPSPGAASATPSASAEPTPEATPTGQPTPTPPQTGQPSPSSVATVYTVRAGDTLSSIARAWGTSVAQLQAWNADRYPSLADNPNVVEPGWELIVSGDPDATPRPTPVATPVPTAKPTSSPVASGCTAGNRVAAGSAHTYYAVPGAGSAVALTFDMGGRLDPGVEILNFLIDNKVCATIFPTGVMADTSQGRQVMAIIAAHPELFEIGNHTMHHCDLVRGGGGSPTTAPCAGVTPTAQFIQQELTASEQILRNLAGQNPQPYWRPPYGSINDGVISAAAGAGYTKTMMWDVDTIDWKPISDGGPTAQQIGSKVVTKAGSGSVVLMHLGGYETLDALHIMVPGLRDRGFMLTSISDLLN